MTDKNKLLNQLDLLNHIQFDRLMFGLDEYIDQNSMPGPNEIKVKREMELINQFDQKNALNLLQEKLDELKYFEIILPEGAYLVNEKLLKREEDKEREKLGLAEARGKETETLKITPEKFYTFRDEAKWIGIFRNWDSKRKFYPKLYGKVLELVDGGKVFESVDRGDKYPVSAIIGSGGSGKSVVLRRLAVDLANRGFKVWWVTNPERFLNYGIYKLAYIDDSPQFLLFDEVQLFEESIIDQLNQQQKENNSLISIVAGRHLPSSLNFGVKSKQTTVFNSDDTNDLSSILDKIAETLPEWANMAVQLKTESLQKARLIQILVVLAKQKMAPQNLEELEEHFIKILADDIRRIKKILPGLDEAVIEAAVLCELGCYISLETFISIADSHNPHANIRDYLEDFTNERWKSVEYILSYDQEFKNIKFNHEELAKGVLLAVNYGLFGESLIIDNTWKKVLLKSIIESGSKYSSSYALRAFALNKIIDEEQILKYITQLLDEKHNNGHHAYLRLILNEEYNFSLDERLNLLKLAVTVAPYNNFLWGPVWTWIKNNNKLNKESRVRILKEFYQAGCQSYDILNNLLDNLPEKEALLLAEKLLKIPNISKIVILHCLYLKSKDGTKDIEKWLDENSGDSKIRVYLLKLIESNGSDEQKNRIIENTEKWLDENPYYTNIRASLLTTVVKNGSNEQKNKIIQDTQKWLEENPDYSNIRVSLLTTVEKNGSDEQKNKIIQDTQKWLEENSYKIDVFDKFIPLLIGENRSDQAINIAKKAFEFNSENSAYLGSYLRLMQDVMTADEFKTYYELLFKMLPKDYGRRLHFANLLRDKGYYVEAGNLYFYLIEKDPKNLKLYYGYGCLLLILKDYEKAAENFRRVLTFHKGHAAAHDSLGVALAELGKFEEAEKEFDEAIYWAKVTGDKTGKFHHDLGVMYLEKLNRLEEAEKEFKKGIKENPDIFANYWHLGKIYYLQKKYILSEENLLNAIEKAPLDLGPPASEEIENLLKECEKRIKR